MKLKQLLEMIMLCTVLLQQTAKNMPIKSEKIAK